MSSAVWTSVATSCGLFTGLRRCAPHFENSVRWRRQLSSLCSSSSPVERRKDDELKSKIFGLKSKIFGLKNPGRSATTVIQKWVDRGNKVSVLELRRISIQLLKSKRFDHALQILAWMEAQSDFRLSPGDHTTRLESIIKLKGMLKAEEYFENLAATASKKSCLSSSSSWLCCGKGHRESRGSDAEAWWVGADCEPSSL